MTDLYLGYHSEPFHTSERMYSARYFWLLWVVVWSVMGIQAQDVPSIRIVPFAEGLELPVDIQHCGDERLFVVERKGRIRIVWPDGTVEPEPFLDIRSRVASNGQEMGLLGLAFHPDYKDNGYFYVNYTAARPRRTVIARYQRSPIDSNKADPNSEQVLFTFMQPYSNHNGGGMVFGPDGYLYIGTGDGGSANDPHDYGQNLQTHLGKILRIDVDVEHAPFYTIPEDNPFFGRDDANEKIWAYGLRNPWRFSFDRLTGDLYIADVGQKKVEEVNFQPARSSGGANYGWRCYEGTKDFNLKGCGDRSNYVFPIFEYYHGKGDCSVTGGYVYRGQRYPSLYGWYFVGDFCSGRIWVLRYDSTTGTWQSHDLGKYNAYAYASFGENSEGELFVTHYQLGRIDRIEATTTNNNTQKKIADEGAVLLYPNPMREKLFVYARTSVPYQWELYDLTGKRWAQGRFSGQRAVLQLGDVAPGIYLLHIRIEGASWTYRLVKI